QGRVRTRVQPVRDELPDWSLPALTAGIARRDQRRVGGWVRRRFALRARISQSARDFPIAVPAAGASVKAGHGTPSPRARAPRKVCAAQGLTQLAIATCWNANRPGRRVWFTETTRSARWPGIRSPRPTRDRRSRP